MAITGSLREAGLADVCQLLALGQKSGCLSVMDGARTGQIYFKKGRVTYATVSNRRDRLGDMLVRDGVLTYDQLSAIVDRQEKEPSRRLGELIVEAKLLDQDTLEQYVRKQIEEAVYHLLSWKHGTFSFEVDRVPGEGEILVSLNTENLLLEGARRTDEWEVIRQKVSSFELCFVADPDHIAESGAELTPVQEALIPLLDGTRNVNDLVEATGWVEFEVGSALYGLVQAGFAKQAGRRAIQDKDREAEARLTEHFTRGVAFYRAGDCERAGGEFRRVIELRPGHQAARFQLALIDLVEGRARNALVQLKSLIDDSGPRPATVLNLAHALMRLNRHEDALIAVEQAEVLRPGSPAASLLRGAILLRLEKPMAARESFEEYVQRLPEGESPVATYYHDAALADALSGRLNAAEALVEAGLERYPEHAPLLILAGVIAERRGDGREAARLFQSAADLRPELAQAHRNLGDIAADAGATGDALAHYERAVAASPRLGSDTYARMADLHYQRHARDQAVRYWRKALELDPNHEAARKRLQLVADARA